MFLKKSKGSIFRIYVVVWFCIRGWLCFFYNKRKGERKSVEVGRFVDLVGEIVFIWEFLIFL